MQDESEVPEPSEGRVAKIKQHLKENKQVYLIGAGCLVAGYFLRRPRVVTPVINTINNTPLIAPVFNNTINNGSYARKIIRCLETDELWPSMTKAAEAAGHTLKAMSQHIHGHIDNIDGLHYVIEGVTAS